jgi:lipoate-protein ligase A
MIEFAVDGNLDGNTNMQRDIAAAHRSADGMIVARVYGWQGPWVSLGRFQSPDLDLPTQTNVPFVMRPTGGRAVLHGHDVTIGLAIPFSAYGGKHREAKRAYRVAAEPIIQALRACGVKARLAEQTQYCGKGPGSSDCFAANSPNDIVDEESGKKVCGCALQLTSHGVLVQASIPKGPPLVDPLSAISGGVALEVREWDSGSFPSKLMQALRYNFTHVSP